MKTYKICIDVGSFYITVEADSEEEAEVLAQTEANAKDLNELRRWVADIEEQEEDE